MKLLFTVFCILGFTVYGSAQDEIEEIPYVRILALDKSPKEADQFNQQIAQGAVDYTLAFVDTENSPTIRYVYKTTKNETLRIDYKYIMESGGEKKRPKRVVTMQRISGNLQVITAIYNFLFNSNISSANITSAATIGASVGNGGALYHFTFQPDDYNPGYWVMTFVR